MTKRYYLVYILAVCCFLFPNLVDAQCAMCRAVLESGESQETAKGINNGIIYLMVIPYLVIGVIGYFVYKQMQPAK